MGQLDSAKVEAEAIFSMILDQIVQNCPVQQQNAVEAQVRVVRQQKDAFAAGVATAAQHALAALLKRGNWKQVLAEQNITDAKEKADFAKRKRYLKLLGAGMSVAEIKTTLESPDRYQAWLNRNLSPHMARVIEFGMREGILSSAERRGARENLGPLPQPQQDLVIHLRGGKTKALQGAAGLLMGQKHQALELRLDAIRAALVKRFVALAGGGHIPEALSGIETFHQLIDESDVMEMTYFREKNKLKANAVLAQLGVPNRFWAQ